jgi:hypothetical protein
LELIHEELHGPVPVQPGRLAGPEHGDRPAQVLQVDGAPSTNVRVMRLVSGVDQPPYGWHVIRRRPLSTLCGYLVGGDGTVRPPNASDPVGTIRMRATFDLADDLAATQADMCPTCYAHLVADPDVQVLCGGPAGR